MNSFVLFIGFFIVSWYFWRVSLMATYMMLVNEKHNEALKPIRKVSILEKCLFIIWNIIISLFFGLAGKITKEYHEEVKKIFKKEILKTIEDFKKDASKEEKDLIVSNFMKLMNSDEFEYYFVKSSSKDDE